MHYSNDFGPKQFRVLGGLLFVFGCSIWFAKLQVNENRATAYRPTHHRLDELEAAEVLRKARTAVDYDDLGSIKPGFRPDGSELGGRASEYEGTGVAATNRLKGDRITGAHYWFGRRGDK